MCSLCMIKHAQILHFKIVRRGLLRRVHGAYLNAGDDPDGVLLRRFHGLQDAGHRVVISQCKYFHPVAVHALHELGGRERSVAAP
uniref:Uncharacterized protein n=1 Tax=Arundo donax TaxID=35708 RepID=A0A0A8XWF7_ARUDO